MKIFLIVNYTSLVGIFIKAIRGKIHGFYFFLSHFNQNFHVVLKCDFIADLF